MIRILSIKIFKQNVHTNRIYDYSLNLTGLASQHKGFIDSENFWNYNMDNMDDSHLFTLSKWQTLIDWDNWKHSSKRIKFHEDCVKDRYIGDILKTTKFYNLNDREVINNFNGL